MEGASNSESGYWPFEIRFINKNGFPSQKQLTIRGVIHIYFKDCEVSPFSQCEIFNMSSQDGTSLGSPFLCWISLFLNRISSLVSQALLLY